MLMIVRINFLGYHENRLLGKNAWETFELLGFSKDEVTSFIQKVIDEGYAETIHTL